MEEKVNALLENAEFSAKVEQAKSVAELAALFTAEGVEVTEEELKNVLEKAENEELDEASLDDVAGGTAIFVAAAATAAAVAYLKKKYGSKWKDFIRLIPKIAGTLM